MIFQRSEGLQKVVVFCQSILAIGIFWISGIVSFTFLTTTTPNLLRRYPYYLAATLIGLWVELARREKMRARASLFADSLLKQHRLSWRQTVFGLGSLVLYIVATKDQGLSRSFLAVFAPSLYLMLLLSNHYLPRWLAQLTFSRHEEKTLLIGPSSKAERLRKWLQSKQDFGFRSVGILCEDYSGSANPHAIIHGFEYLGEPKEVERVVRERSVTQVILLELPSFTHVHQHLLSVLERYPVRLLILSNLDERLRHPVVHVEDEGLHFITLRQEPLENPWNCTLKRSLDIAIALPVVIFILPLLCLVVWLVQRQQAPGPLFYRQKRAGIQNREFEILKFRTMHVAEFNIAQQASKEDPRIYPAGKFLRKYSLDEMPQFWNVLKGDMSVVGPRPHLLVHNEQFARALRNYHIRAFVKPGITGLAQVRGFRGEARSDQDIAHRLESDILYMENWTPALDCAVIIRTAAQVFMPLKTAY
jgi:exopolysaccharide biosynthesis polyprenyl glycosylphosphotransferase